MTARIRREGRVFMKNAEAMPQADDFHQRIRALEALAPGPAIYAIEVFEVERPIVAGDRAFEFEIPEDLDNSTLVKVEGYINTAGSGSTQIQIRNRTQAADMLSTKITIDSGELISKDSTTEAEVDLPNATVEWGDMISVDVDAIASGGLGMGVILYFLPAETARLIIEGAQGPAGGITDWLGQWLDAHGYVVGDAVSNNGTTYVSIVNHTSTTASEPGVGANWEDFWQVLVEANTTSSIEVVINGNGRVIDVGPKAYIEVPFNCTLDEVIMLADFAGNAVVDIWKDTYANYPPTNADSITSATPPTITASNKSMDSVLSGWTTTFTAGDILAFNVDSCSAITILTVSLKVLR